MIPHYGTILLLLLIWSRVNIFNASKPIANVFLLGVQKGGSSSLYIMMLKHQMICGAINFRKEPHFFTHQFEFDKGREFYEDYFTPKGFNDKSNSKCRLGKGSIYLDGSTMMHKMDEVAPRIKQFYGKDVSRLKFIVLFREPVSRDYSWYQHFTRNFIGHIPDRFPSIQNATGHFNVTKTMDQLMLEGVTQQMKTFQDSVEFGNSKSTTEDIRGDYAYQLASFLRYFDRKQILVLNSDTAIMNTTQTMESIRLFLNLPTCAAWKGPLPHQDHTGAFKKDPSKCVVKHVPPMDCKFKELLVKFYNPFNKALYKLISETRPKAHPAEPNFPEFSQAYDKILCVNDAVMYYKNLTVNDNKGLC